MGRHLLVHFSFQKNRAFGHPDEVRNENATKPQPRGSGLDVDCASPEFPCSSRRDGVAKSFHKAKQVNKWGKSGTKKVSELP